MKRILSAIAFASLLVFTAVAKTITPDEALRRVVSDGGLNKVAAMRDKNLQLMEVRNAGDEAAVYVFGNIGKTQCFMVVSAYISYSPEASAAWLTNAALGLKRRFFRGFMWKLQMPSHGSPISISELSPSFLQGYLNGFCYKFNCRYFGELFSDKMLVALHPILQVLRAESITST